MSRTSSFVPTNRHARNGARKIAVVGTGYVGLVTGACLAELGNSVVCLDNDSQKIATLRRNELPFFEPRLHELTLRNSYVGRLSFSDDVAAGLRDPAIVFIAVGTPMRSDHDADLSSICDVAAAIGRALNGPKIIVLKSTVPVETNELVSTIIAENAAGPYKVEVVSNPEFLREGSAVNDFMHPDRVVIGTRSAQAEAIMRELYAPLKAPFVVTDMRTAEMIKYTANAFLATKVSFINEIANICELVGVDVKTVSAAVAYDERIGSSFMNPGIGYGGSCFPKDVLALERIAHGQHYDASLLRCVDGINRAQVARSFEKIRLALGEKLKGKTVCVLGLAFKPNTSDVREAPGLNLIESFITAGAEVVAHDPIAIDSARARFGSAIRYQPELYDAMRDCDALVLATEWDHYKNIDFAKVRKAMRGNVIFDGRNLFDPNDVVGHGLHYIGVGRPQQPAPVFAP